MTLLYLVRHGRAAAGWDVAIDPPLDELGGQQSRAAALSLVHRIEQSEREHGGAPLIKIDVVTSPLRRCRETADAFTSLGGAVARVESRIAEIPSPAHVPMEDRITWLRRIMQGTWSDLIAAEGATYQEFHAALVAWACDVRVDTVAFSHFVAINALVGAAIGDDRVVIRSLDNASVTTLHVNVAGKLTLVAGGAEADSLIR